MPSMNRRDALGALAKTGAALFGAPMVLRGRFELFGQQGATYSARAVRLVEETVVIDMLNQFRFPDFAEKSARHCRCRPQDSFRQRENVGRNPFSPFRHVFGCFLVRHRIEGDVDAQLQSFC